MQNAYLMTIKTLSPEKCARVDRLVIAGELSVRAIANDYGVSEGAVRRRIKTRHLLRNLKPKIAARTEQKLIEAIGKGMEKAKRQALRQQLREVVAPG